MDFKFLALIFLGSAVGGMARFVVSDWAARRFGGRFPAGILLVNVTGAFVIGAVWAAPMTGIAGIDGETARSFLILGLLGGYTTVSSFTWDTLTLLREGAWFSAGANAVGSVVLCLAAAFAGYALAGGAR